MAAISGHVWEEAGPPPEQAGLRRERQCRAVDADVTSLTFSAHCLGPGEPMTGAALGT